MKCIVVCPLQVSLNCMKGVIEWFCFFVSVIILGDVYFAHWLLCLENKTFHNNCHTLLHMDMHPFNAFPMEKNILLVHFPVKMID